MINPHPQQLSMGLLTPGVLGGGGGEGGGSHGAELSGVLGVAVAPVSEVGAGAVVQAAPVVQVAPGGEGGGGGWGGRAGGVSSQGGPELFRRPTTASLVTRSRPSESARARNRLSTRVPARGPSRRRASVQTVWGALSLRKM